MYHKHVLLGFESREGFESLRNNLKYCRTVEWETMVSLIINFLDNNNKTGREFIFHMRKLFFA